MNDELKTSNEWNSIICKKLGVLYFIKSPSGWDSKDFSKSYYSEKITKQEFENRLAGSTLIGSPTELTSILGSL